MSGAAPATNEMPPRPARGPRLGCLARVALGIVAAVALVIAIGLIFDQGDDASQPSRGFNAGAAENYQRADVNYVPTEHIFITRLQDGEFIALYDKSSRQQELGGDCRVTWDDAAQTGTLEQLPGFTGALVEQCEDEGRTVWRADGTFAFGAGYGNLDRFAAKIRDDGTLFIDTRSRTCTRSRGVPGVPPFVASTCRGND